VTRKEKKGKKGHQEKGERKRLHVVDGNNPCDCTPIKRDTGERIGGGKSNWKKRKEGGLGSVPTPSSPLTSSFNTPQGGGKKKGYGEKKKKKVSIFEQRTANLFIVSLSSSSSDSTLPPRHEKKEKEGKKTLQKREKKQWAKPTRAVHS